MAIKQKTDLETANEALVQLKPNVTASDRKECQHSEATIVAYLNGLGKNLDTALEMLQFFTKRIEDRRQLISEITN